MNRDLTKAITDWDNEVQAEMAKLIKEGVAPYDAADQARNNVSKVRSRPLENQLTPLKP